MKKYDIKVLKITLVFIILMSILIGIFGTLTFIAFNIIFLLNLIGSINLLIVALLTIKDWNKHIENLKK